MNQRVNSQYGFSRFTIYRPWNEIVHFHFLTVKGAMKAFERETDHGLTSKFHHIGFGYGLIHIAQLLSATEYTARYSTN